MLNRFCQRKYAILSTLAILQHDHTLLHTDWEIANQAIKILQIFSDVTIEISAEEHVSISKIPLFVTAMDTHIKQFTNATLDNNIHKMVDVFLKEIQELFRNIESNELVAQTVILDPKYGFKDQLKT